MGWYDIAEEPKFDAGHLLELRKLAEKLPYYRDRIRPFVQKFNEGEIEYKDMTEKQKIFLWSIYSELDDITEGN